MKTSTRLALIILHTQTTGAPRRHTMQQPRCLWLRWVGLVMLAFVLWAPRTATAEQDSHGSIGSLLEPPPPTPGLQSHQYNETLAYQFVDLCGTYSVLAWLCLSRCPSLACPSPPHLCSTSSSLALSPRAKPTIRQSSYSCSYQSCLCRSSHALSHPHSPITQAAPIAASTAVTPVLPDHPSTCPRSTPAYTTGTVSSLWINQAIPSI